MACATLVPQTGKRRIDCVDGPDHAGSSLQCKRFHGTELNLSPADFDSPSRYGRASPNQNREAGRGPSRPLLLKRSSPSPPLATFFSELNLKTKTEVGRDSIQHCADARQSSDAADVRYTAQQVIDICKQQATQLNLRLQQEYEATLQDKLAEQYQSFVQFAQDQLGTPMQGSPPEMECSYIG
ncbi:akirin-like [Paramacrobiotus metropolitanus]|uniref:akirin-like n=1 Tax=Paramacrobiotus metropolitanus TaxID=2943436 RepID=UPI002445EF2B|nr:akirin-like [Paramacrobiotus metropolitanus]XP_055350437.1 akirin-like [Paramacrobiotus metropolitanus]XP_055350438.1 akirin-like [Paramacrobiotus metropolitanus]XP_055350439.1 akirin-like [Paramacrobiotus metropolitanus]